MGEARDWVAVVGSGRCGSCGWEADGSTPAALAEALRVDAAAWAVLLAADPGATSLRRHPSGGGWSALEHGAHVRDVLAVFADRVDRARVEDEPELGWWDHETSVVQERYNDQPPDRVAADLAANAVRLGDALARAGSAGWGRAATRRAGEGFTIGGMGRFAWHECHHHRVEAARLLAS